MVRLVRLVPGSGSRQAPDRPLPLAAAAAPGRNQVDGASLLPEPRQCSIDPVRKSRGAAPAWDSWGAGGICDPRYPAPSLTAEEPHPRHIVPVAVPERLSAAGGGCGRCG